MNTWDVIVCFSLFQVVLTTLSTSLLLTELDIEGYFSHIFIDEGGQALETESIMPLSLATPSTCVVMAGDHKQMGPKVKISNMSC